MTQYFFFTILIISSYLGASSSILVELSTEDNRTPLYLNALTVQGSGLPAEHVKRLEETLRFDLSHNGSTLCLDSSPRKDTSGVGCSVTATLANKTLSIVMADTKGTWQKSLDGIALSGDTDDDRRQMHRVADAIHYTLFNLPGIASTHLLYTLRLPGEKPNTWISEVWEADYDGKNAKRVARDSGYCVTPTYLPPKEGKASSAFLYVSYANGQPKMYLSSLKDFKPQRLSLLRGNQLMPTVSKQRDKIAFISDATGNPDLFLQDFSTEKGLLGKPYQVIATHSATQASPTFSPDGKRLAFASNKDGNPRIYMIEIAKVVPGKPLKDAKLLTRACRENSAPVWSPDGEKIAYCALTDGVRQIWVYDVTADQEIQISHTPLHKENPSWAPNSRVLVYNTIDQDKGDLYLLDLAMPVPVQLTSGNGQKRFPSWEPRS